MDINAIIEQTKADKSIVQPWRNYALKALNEAQAFIKMGKLITLAEPPAGTCICPDGATLVACPVHGTV